MRSLWLIALMFLPALIFAQDTLNTSEVPKQVLTSFERRNRNVEDAVWLKEDDKFVVTYQNRYNKREYKHYNKEGELLKTIQRLDVEDIRSNMLDYIDENYGMYEPYEAYYIEEDRRNRYYSIYMEHRKAEEPPKTEIQFDQSGRYLTIYNLYIPDDEDDEEEMLDEDFAEEVDEESSELATQVDEREVRKKELPSGIIEYIEEMYPYPYRLKSAKLENSPDGPVYQVIMKIQGKDFHHEIIFDYRGVMLSDEKVYEVD